MKLAVLLPGYLDSPDYLHFRVFEKRLSELGYKVIRLDPCNVWHTSDLSQYNMTNYLKDVRKVVDEEKNGNLEELVLIGHSLGAYVSIIGGSEYKEVTKIVALCPPADYIDSGKKWNNGERKSRRDLPDRPNEYRIFTVPVSFSEDAKKYSARDALQKLHKPVMIFIGLEDKAVLPEVTEGLVDAAIDPYVVRKEGIGHDFRKSAEQSQLVMNEIEKFLRK